MLLAIDCFSVAAISSAVMNVPDGRLLFPRRETEHEREQCQHGADYKLSLAVARKMICRSATHE